MLAFTTTFENDIWTDVDATDIKVVPLEENGDILIPTYQSTYNLTASDGAIHETISVGNTGLLLCYPRDGKLVHEPVRETAFTDLLERGNHTGTIYRKMSPQDRAICINIPLSYAHEKKAKILLRGEKITAVHSGNYQVFPVNQLVNRLLNYLQQTFGGYTFQKGHYNHSLFMCELAMDSKKSDITAAYNAILTKHNRPKVTSITPVLRLVTSDIGNSSIHLVPMLRNNLDDSCMVVGQPISITHEKKNDWTTYETSLSKIYAMLMSAPSQAEALLNINILHPLDCFKRLARVSRLPKTEADEAYEFFEATLPQDCTAYDVYCGLWEAIENMMAKGTPTKSVLTAEESLARLMVSPMEFRKHDHIV